MKIPLPSLLVLILFFLSLPEVAHSQLPSSSWSMGGHHLNYPGSHSLVLQNDRDNRSPEQRNTFRKHLFYSGFYGIIYGTEISAAFDLGDIGPGFPLFAGAAAIAFPLLTIPGDTLSQNSMLLAGHGKLVGTLYGSALAGILLGEPENDTDAKLLISSALLTSIGLGRLGYAAGKEASLTGGQTALYRHYGLLMPAEGIGLLYSFGLENFRAYAVSTFLFGSFGYYLAGYFGQRNPFTRGDILATQNLSILSLTFMIGLQQMVLPEDVRSPGDPGFPRVSFLLPVAGAIAGTLAGQRWTRDARLSLSQGRRTLYLSLASSFLFWSASLSSENPGPLIIAGSLAGVTSHSLLMRQFKKNQVPFPQERSSTTGPQFTFNPLNILYNKKFPETIRSDSDFRNLPRPVFSLNWTF